MNNLKAKLKKQGGFTLIEMLIVVAIIAILIAVSIPLVNGALERSREATDAANERSFKAELLISYTLGEFDAVGGTSSDFTAGNIYAYDAANGALLDTGATGYDAPDAYGKSTDYEGTDGINRTTMILYGSVDADDGTVVMKWAASAPANFAALEALSDDTNGLLYTKMVAN